MNKSNLSEIIVGLSFLAGVSLLGFYTIVAGDFSWEGKKLYLADFDSVYGLKEGDGVRVEGHESGEVKSIRLLPNGKVRVLLEVKKEVEIYRNGGEVRVTPFSPLGGRVVAISRGHEPSEESEDPRGTYAAYTRGMSDAEANQVAILGVAEGELLQTLNELIEDNDDNIGQIVENIKVVTDQLTRTNNVLGYLINDQAASRKLSSITDNLESAAKRVNRIVTRVDEGQGLAGALTRDDTALSQNLAGAIEAGKGALEHGEAILERADKGESALGVLVSAEPGPADDVRGIVRDVKHVTGEVARTEDGGTLSKLVHDDRLYEGAAETAQNLSSITHRVDEGKGLLGVLLEERTGDNARETLDHLASITRAVDDPKGGTLGMIVHDQELRKRVGRIAGSVERLVVDFRDSLEDVREQAPVNAFIGAIFAAF